MTVAASFDDRVDRDGSAEIALAHARHLIKHGVPVFVAEPAMKDGDWVPDGGTGATGYWLPNDWQHTVPDLAVLDRWRAGMALCAVMGHTVDALDIDPRHDGDKTEHGLRAGGLWPNNYGRAATPSGGTHDLVAKLNRPSRDGFRQGIDYKGGTESGHGRGFIFVAPTARLSKSTGEIAEYRWIEPPMLDEIDPSDDSGVALADMLHAPDTTITTVDNVVMQFLTGFTLPEVIRCGQRDEMLHRQAWKLRGLGTTVTDAVELMTAAWRRCEQPPGDIYPLEAALAKIDRAWAKTASPIPGTGTKSPVDGTERSAKNGEAGTEPTGRRVVLTAASKIKPRRVKWLWLGRLALGTLSLLAGREGLGKSTVAIWVAARITLGLLPGEYQGTPRAVLICASEDSWEHTIVPRLIAAGADLDRVHRVETISADDIQLGLSLPRDLHELERHARETGAAMLLLDPLMSRLAADLDTHRDGDVRHALEPLVAVADRTGMAVVGLIHHNKSGSTDPLQLVMASRAFTAVARSVHSVVPDSEDETGERRLFGTVKNNLGRADLPTMTFTVTPYDVPTDDGVTVTGRIAWGKDSAVSIAETMRRAAETAETRSATDEAAGWLTDYLRAAGGRAASAEIKSIGRQAGHSADALKRACARLHLHIKSEGFPRTTYWSMQSDRPVGADA